MRRHALLLLSLACCVLAAGCGASVGGATSANTPLKNPLVAERYWDEMIDRLTTLQISGDPLLQDPKKADVVEDAKRDALQRSQQARETVRSGISGDFVSAAELTEGRALLLKGVLYLGSTFTTYPAPTLRIYVTESVDPRGAPFPDATTVDLGELKTPYGAQEYVLPEDERENAGLRTVVLWDRRLERLIGFAQLAK